MSDKFFFQNGREAYSYIPGKLVRTAAAQECDIHWVDLRLSSEVPPADWHTDTRTRANFSSIKLDEFHSALLMGNHPQQILHGLLSVVFWGNLSGRDAKVNIRRALRRASWHISGKVNSAAQSPKDIVLHLVNARDHLTNRRIADALTEVMRIKYLDLAFGSKVLAFMQPEVAAVYDKVISSRLASSSDPDVRMLANGVMLRQAKEKADLYSAWCGWCFNKAAALNEAGATWRDWDGKKHAFRAIDTERAIYSVSH